MRGSPWGRHWSLTWLHHIMRPQQSFPLVPNRPSLLCPRPVQQTNRERSATSVSLTASSVRVVAVLPLLACLFGILAVGVGLLQPVLLLL